MLISSIIELYHLKTVRFPIHPPVLIHFFSGFPMKLVTQAVDFEGLDIFGVDEVTWIGVVFNGLGDAANYFSHVDRLLYVINYHYLSNCIS